MELTKIELKARIQKRDLQIEKHKLASEKRQKEKERVKVYKIIIREEYHEKCSECNRQLKRALMTDKGVLGFDCYLRKIGLPSRKQNLNIKDLPDETFEGIAEDVIEQIKHIHPEKMVKIIIPNVNTKNLKYPVRFQSEIHLSYYQENYKGTGQGRWIYEGLIPSGIWSLGRKLKILPEVMDKVYASKSFNQYWRSQVKKVNENMSGISIEDLIKKIK